MMLSPESYYELNLKGKSADEIWSEIDQLKKHMSHLKDQLENPARRREALLVHPSPSTRIFCERLYLQRAIQALEELGELYTPSPEEKQAIEFDTRIDKIKEIVLHIGCFFETQKETIVKLQDGQALFFERVLGEADEVPVSEPMDAAEFLTTFRDLHIGEWQKHYSCERFGYMVLDGTQWKLTIKYADGRQDCVITGDNCYPYNFAELLELLGRSEYLTPDDFPTFPQDI